MRKAFVVGLVFGLWGSVHSAAPTLDLKKIRCIINKEPVYQSKTPKYCLLVFGPKAQARVWLVVDGDVLYVDRNGNGDLTEKGERIPLTEAENAFLVKDLHLAGEPFFHYPRLSVQRWGREACGVTLDADLWSQTAGGECGLEFAVRPAQSPIIHFNGPLVLDDTRQALGDNGAQTLVRGEQTRLRVCIGTPGLGKGTFAFLCHERAAISASPSPAKSESKECNVTAQEQLFTGVYPIAQIEFPANGSATQTIHKKVFLKKRCCGCWFFDNVAVPAQVGKGNAKVTLSCPDWQKGKIAPAVFEIPVVDAED